MLDKKQGSWHKAEHYSQKTIFQSNIAIRYATFLKFPFPLVYTAAVLQSGWRMCVGRIMYHFFSIFTKIVNATLVTVLRGIMPFI